MANVVTTDYAELANNSLFNPSMHVIGSKITFTFLLEIHVLTMIEVHIFHSRVAILKTITGSKVKSVLFSI